MVVPERGERISIEVDVAGASFADGPDARQGNGRAGQAAAGADREQQLVILTSVERLLESRARESWRRGDIGRDSGGDTKALEVERESVAEVHRGSGVGAHAEESAEGEAGLRAGMTFPGGASARSKAERRSAQRAGN